VNALIDLGIAGAAGAGMALLQPSRAHGVEGIVVVGAAAATGLGVSLMLDEEGFWEGSPSWNPSYTFWTALGLAAVGGTVLVLSRG
jgi:hypothetical protein